MEKFRTLRADEIDCRVATVKSAGVILLLYKDARCDIVDNNLLCIQFKQAIHENERKKRAQNERD